MKTVSIKTTATDQNPHIEGMPAGSSHYVCSLEYDGRRMDGIPFSQGPAIKTEPTADDVLECLLSDAIGIEAENDFTSWADSYGYDIDDEDARERYHAMYLKIEEQTRAVSRLLGDDFDAFCDKFFA